MELNNLIILFFPMENICFKTSAIIKALLFKFKFPGERLSKDKYAKLTIQC